MKNKNSFLVKFAVVAAMVGFFSPSVSVKTMAPVGNGFGAIPIEMNISLFTQAEARRGGGGGARRGGGGARRGGSANRGRSSNRNRSTNRNRNKNVNRNSNRNSNRNINRNSNRNVNRNVNRNRNVNVNVNRNNRYYGRRGYYGGRPLLAFGTGLAIGSMITAASMPSSCVTTYVNGISYRQCGSSYYQPFYEGDTVAYRVVSSPY